MKRWEWLKPLTILRLGLSLLIAGQAIPARELLASSPTTAVISLNVACPVAGNPTAITSINAAPYFPEPNEAAGGVTLSWSAPSSADGSPVYSYAIKYATFSASGFGSADAWWNNPNTLTALQAGTLPVLGWLAQATPGNTETVTLTGLTPAAYYYFGIRARDKYFSTADYDTGLKNSVTVSTSQAQTYAATYPLIPGKVTSLAAQTNAQIGSVNLSWTMPQFIDPSIPLPPPADYVNGKIYYPAQCSVQYSTPPAYGGDYCVQYSTTMPPAGGSDNPPNMGNNWPSSTQLFISTSNVQTSQYQSVTITGLMLPTTYYFLTFVRNEWPTHWSAIATNYAAVRPFSAINPVTGLSAAAGASNSVSTGSYVSLNWTNSNSASFGGVRICYSTTTTPSTPSSAQFIDLQPETSGQVVLYQHIQLIPRTTYYYTVYAFNQGESFFSAGASTQCYTGLDILAPDPVNNVKALANVDNSGPSARYYVNLSWTTPPATPYYRNSDYAGAQIYFSTYTQVSSAQTYLGTVTGLNSQPQALTHNNLAAFTTYYYSMFSFDSANPANVSTTPVTTSAYISGALVTPSAPQIITMLVGANPNPAIGCNIYLQWTTPPEADVSNTRVIYRTDRYPANASDGSVLLDTQAVPSSAYSLTAAQLSPSTTYYIMIFAYTGYGIYSRSAEISGFTSIPWLDNLAPMSPLGLQITKASASTLAISWAPVHYNADRTRFLNPGAPSLLELYGYEVYRSTEIFGKWALVGNNNSVTTKYADTLPAAAGKYYYKIRAKDASYNYADSNIIDTDGYVHVLCSDGSSLVLPQGKMPNDVMLMLNRDTTDEKGPIIKSLEWEPYSLIEGTATYTLQKMGNFTSYDASASEFNNLSISYANGASNGVQLAPALRAIAANGDEIENMVSIFYFNGVEWLTLGSSTDKANMAVAAKAKFAGKYQLRIAAPATDFTFYGVMPRIITPNNDGQNDRALFRYANPKARNISIEIFDLRGALVKDIGETNATSDAQGEYIYWDAKDNSGNIVPVGVYIYQLKGAGKVVNGTIVVAR